MVEKNGQSGADFKASPWETESDAKEDKYCVSWADEYQGEYDIHRNGMPVDGDATPLYKPQVAIMQALHGGAQLFFPGSVMNTTRKMAGDSAMIDKINAAKQTSFPELDAAVKRMNDSHYPAFLRQKEILLQILASTPLQKDKDRRGRFRDVRCAAAERYIDPKGFVGLELRNDYQLNVNSLMAIQEALPLFASDQTSFLAMAGVALKRVAANNNPEESGFDDYKEYEEAVRSVARLIYGDQCGTFVEQADNTKLPMVNLT